MIKKFMTCLLAAAMAVSVTSPASGSDSNSNSDTYFTAAQEDREVGSDESGNDLSPDAAETPEKAQDKKDPDGSGTREVYLSLDMSRVSEPDETVYYAAHKSSDGRKVSGDISGQMDKADDLEKDGRIFRHMLKTSLPDGYDRILFSREEIERTDEEPSPYLSTRLFEIPEDLEHPCLYLDDEDPSVYINTPRDGIWREAGTVRYPEEEAAEKGESLVEIPEGERETDESKIRYLPVDLYDDYSDQELNGIARSRYGEDGSTDRSYAQFRIYDMALSDAWKRSGATPFYTGHFQPDGVGGAPFSDIADLLNLKGWEDPTSFFAINNSIFDADGSGDPRNYAAAVQGLVSEELKGDQLMDSSGKQELPYFDETFLRGSNSRNLAVGQVFHDVAFPFRKVQKDSDGISYWSFDSAEDHVHLMEDGQGLYLGDPEAGGDRWSRNVDSTGSPDSGTLSDAYGFFPFNDLNVQSGKNYNFGFGVKIGFDFYLPEGGVIRDSEGNEKPVTFSFSGDDDVWVFIDGRLALDVGGDHGKVTGTLDFRDRTACVSCVKKGIAGTDVETGPGTTHFSLEDRGEEPHHLTMFYLERGMWESNLKVEYSLSPKPFTPTPELTKEPTPEPEETPTPEPTETPTPEPTETPTPEPMEAPTPEPTETPTPEPTETPAPEPTETPTPEPTETPAPAPTEKPAPEPAEEPDSGPATIPEESPAPSPAPEVPKTESRRESPLKPASDSQEEPVTESTATPVPEKIPDSEPAEESKPESVPEPDPDSVPEETSETKTEEKQQKKRKTVRHTGELTESPTAEALETAKEKPETAAAEPTAAPATKTRPVATGDVPLKAIIVPILSGLLTLYAYLKRKHKKNK